MGRAVSDALINMRLKELRSDADLEQEELINLAEEVDENFSMARSTYSSKETGKRKIHLAEAYIFSKVLADKLNEPFLKIYSYIFLDIKFTNSEINQKAS